LAWVHQVEDLSRALVADAVAQGTKEKAKTARGGRAIPTFSPIE